MKQMIDNLALHFQGVSTWFQAFFKQRIVTLFENHTSPHQFRFTSRKSNPCMVFFAEQDLQLCKKFFEKRWNYNLQLLMFLQTTPNILTCLLSGGSTSTMTLTSLLKVWAHLHSRAWQIAKRPAWTSLLVIPYRFVLFHHGVFLFPRNSSENASVQSSLCPFNKKLIDAVNGEMKLWSCTSWKRVISSWCGAATVSVNK